MTMAVVVSEMENHLTEYCDSSQILRGDNMNKKCHSLHKHISDISPFQCTGSIAVGAKEQPSAGRQSLMPFSIRNGYQE